MIDNDATHYTPVAKMLHWLIAGMIVLQFVLAKMADLAGDADSSLRELALLANHKSVGITILALAIVRLIWRFRHPPPSLPAAVPQWQVMASHVSHWSLYVLLFAMPITGWLMSSASAYSVSWFNLVQLPDLVAPDPDLKQVFKETHEFGSKLLFVIAAIHILAAIRHAISDRDGVLQRMISATSVAAFVIVIALGIGWLGAVGKTPEPTPGSAEAVRPATESERVGAAASPSGLPVWQIDYATSYIRFVGNQAGAEFEGAWETWSAELRFATGNLAAGRFDVTIDATSAETSDAERDMTLADPEWFDSMKFPEAYFRASRFSRGDDGGFIADGQLTIKGFASPVQLRFTVEEDGDSRVLTGTAQLDRLALGVGTGEWEDTEWIGQDVFVEVFVEATVTN